MDHRNDLNVVELLSDLAARDIVLWLEGDRLSYRAPKEALTPQLLTTLRQHKTALIAWLQRRAAVAAGDAASALSQGQLGLWLEWQLDPRSTRYHLVSVDRLPTEVSLESLRDAAQALLDRHPILRTVYPFSDDRSATQPVQRVQAEALVAFDVVDGTAWTPAQLAAWIDQAADQPFDLSSGPIMRMTVVRALDQAGQVEHLLHWSIHHIATDYSSQEVLRHDLAACYEALHQGRKLPASTAALAYHDFVRWETDTISEQGERLETFWREYLSGEISLLDLPNVSTAHQGDIAATKRHSFALDQQLVARLRALARAQKTTLYVVLLAAYEVLLARYTQQDRFLINSPTGIRTLPGWTSTVGYFINPLLVWADVAENPSFRALLQRVHQDYQRVLQHQIYPHTEMLRQLQKQMSLEQLPQAIACLVLVTLRQAEEPSALLEAISSEQRGMPQALTLTFFDRAGELTGMLTYDARRFDDAMIERMAGHLQTLLSGIVADPEQPIRHLPLLTPAEHHQLLVEWNDTAAPYSTDQCFHQLFEAQVERDPDAVALVFEQQHLSYCELNARANQLAHRLRALDVGPESLVGIWLERPLEFVISMLGVLKAGGAYLPLDPTYPHERLAFMLNDAQVSVLLTEAATSTAAATALREAAFSPHLLALETVWQEAAHQHTHNPINVTTPDNLAYVIYTSGSTGKPKGTLLQHRGLVNLTEAVIELFAITPASRVAQFAAWGFDVSVYEIAMGLAAGASLVLASPKMRANPLALVDLLQHEAVSVATLTPSLLMSMTPADFPNLTTVISGSEMCSWEVARRWSPGRRFFNGYGPTEATVANCFYPVTALDDGSMTVPIGRPIANTQVHLLDSFGQPVPVGVPGELHIGGVCVARGYLHRPELTAERFIRDPFSHNSDARLYKTGDLARYLPDGAIEILGRIDQQVKLRGFRIELGEIEAVLRQHPTVLDAMVVARNDDARGTRLVAYLLPSMEHAALPDAVTLTSEASEQLRQFLGQSLPEYMLPVAFVSLSAWPRTPSGKVDRKALPAPDAGQAIAGDVYTAPRSPAEVALAAIYGSVLGVERVSIHDSFFDLGGHSLLAVRLMRQIEQWLGQKLPLATLYEYHTVAELADVLATAGMVEDHAARVPIPAETPAPTSYPLSHGQRALWFVQQSVLGTYAYNSGLALRLRGTLDLKALRGAVADLAARHISLRLTITVEDGMPLQVIQPAGSVELTQVDAAGADAGTLVREHFTRPFDLDRGVFRPMLITSAVDDHVLVLSLHHLATDGGSAAILTHEFAQYYTARTTGAPITLPPPTHTYADYVRWERALIEAAGEQLRAYWHTQLAGELPILQLPLDAPRPPTQTFHGRAYVWTLETELAQRLKSLARERRVTLFTLLLAAYQVLLHRSTGQHDLLVGSAPEAGRTRPEFADVVGYFVNLIALRSTFDPTAPPPFSAFLAQVAQTVSGALTHQHYPFPLLVQELMPRRDPSIPPLVQTLFLLTQREGDDTTFADTLTITPYRLEETGGQGAGQFDLALLVDQQDETLRLVLDYNADLFSAATVERMAGHFTELLGGIVARPEQRIDRLPLLTVAERQQLAAWNDTAAPYSADQCVHELFEAQVAHTPDAVALVFEQQQLSYRELNERANQLAHHLRAMGVGPDILVGIWVERSLEMVIGMLGVLKAGGAYLPLDPTYPAERLAFMLIDAQVSVLLTQAETAATATAALRGASVSPHILALETVWMEAAREHRHNLVTVTMPDHLAYVIYTSGSTGTPKGVLVEHRGLVNFTQALIEPYGVTPASRVVQFAAWGFDASISEITMALTVGATLVLAAPETRANALALVALLQQEAVSVATLPPSLLAVLTPSDFPQLTSVISAGEACSWEVAERWSAGRRFVNAYGPTEASIGSSYYRVTERVAGITTVPIGRPFSNVQIYLLDRYGQQVPVGVAGELHIGGAGVARGYLNRPELTTEKFIRDPFSQQPSARLYKSGDLARYLPDGTIEYLGRLDQQVKLRGFRIELGEIEAALRRHPAVREATVIVQEDTPDERRLVAYVVATSGNQITELRAFLGERLPEYMIPAVFVSLHALPVSSNGKIDRKALPAPAVSEQQSVAQYVAPQSVLERQISALWQDVLQRERVGVHDNFFDLGGHSLLLIQLHDRLQTLDGHTVAVTDLFRYPTVSALAAHLSHANGASADQQPDTAHERAEARRTKQSSGRQQRQIRKHTRREEKQGD